MRVSISASFMSAAAATAERPQWAGLCHAPGMDHIDFKFGLECPQDGFRNRPIRRSGLSSDAAV